MRENIMLLIEDSIVNAKLINTLNRIGIDASLYCNSPTVVFNLLGYKSHKDMDSLYKIYFDLINEAETKDFVESREEVKKSAKKVYDSLVKKGRSNL